MSHKPAKASTERKDARPPVRQTAMKKVPAKKAVSQKSGFVASKAVKPPAECVDDGTPFKLVHSGGNHGVFANGPKGITRLCGALQPMGQTTDPDGGKPAIRVQFRTHVNTVQFYDIPQEWLATPKKVLNELVKRGLVVEREQSQSLARAICMYLHTMMPDTTLLRLIRDGWHQMPDRSIGYMYGDKLFCANPNFQAATQRSHFAKTNVKGNVKDWLKLTRQLGDDHMVVTMMSAGLAAPLLKPFERDATVLTVEGASGTGKTTGLKLVGSCFGPPNDMVTWNSTDNGIEAATRRYQHRPCIVDEIGQGSGKGFDKAAYALTNAAGKLRADTSGNLQESSRNYAMVMSAGEVSAITRMRKAGLTVQDGQKARLPSLKVNGKHGLWDNVRGYGSGAEKSKAITSMLNGCFGHAGAALCEHLVQQLPHVHADYAEVAPKLRDHLVKGLTFDEKDGVFDRMRENFVLFTFAGLMAVDAKAVGWSKQQVMDAIAHSFSQWYTDHLQSQPITDHAVMNHLRLFFQSQRGDKFKPFEQFTEGHKGTVAGYEHAGRAKSEPLFLVFPSYFENVVCKGLDLQTVLSVLRGQDLLVSGSRNVPTKQFHLPGTDNRNVSFYAIKQTILLA
jgi:putative DNA primase/helicase